MSNHLLILVPDKPDSSAANALQEGQGGQFGECVQCCSTFFKALILGVMLCLILILYRG